ncbi:MAG: hypothetical protein AAF821_11470 [Cyanobacteria bacterium P01_D01_bin.156]
MPIAEFRQWVQGLMLAEFTSDDGRTWNHRDNRPASYLSVMIYPDAALSIELGWGVEQSAADELVQQLLYRGNQLALWQVYAGGQGYDRREFGQGADVASFLAYCHCPEK